MRILEQIKQNFFAPTDGIIKYGQILISDLRDVKSF